MTFRNEHAIYSQDEVAEIIGAVRQSIGESEARAMKYWLALWLASPPDRNAPCTQGRA